MDSVQKFISENQHQFGYIMQEASRQWVAKDNVGALTVGDCNFVVEKYGRYHEILEKMQEYEKASKELSNIKRLLNDIRRLNRDGQLYVDGEAYKIEYFCKVDELD